MAPARQLGPSAHVDTFARDNLPPAAQWPEILLDRPEFRYPVRLNAAVELTDRNVERGFGDRIALIGNGRRRTYKELTDWSNRLAHALVENYGVKPGHRVLIRSGNNPALVAAWLAATKAGAVVVNTMPMLRAGELTKIVDKAEVSLALCDSRIVDELTACAKTSKFLKQVVNFDGTSNHDAELDRIALDKPVKFAVTITVEGDRAIFDYSNSGPQAKGPVNLRPAMVEACTFYCLVGALGPYDLHYNGGMSDVVELRFAPNTVTNASAPAPVSSYQKANLKLVDVILEAMAHFAPERAIAGSGSSGSLLISWQGGGREGHSTMQYEIFGSAYGGGNGHDGTSMTATHLSNLHITPIEILESEFPCQISEFTFIPDSGGPGQYRGGLGFRRQYELLQDAMVVRRYERAKFPSSGMEGGSNGRRSRFVSISQNGDETDLPAAGRYDMTAGEGFFLDKAGGGGYGDPKKRDPDAIRRDIAEGYVTREGAKRDYGFEE